MEKLHINHKKIPIELVIIIVLLIVLGILLAVIPTRMSTKHTEKIVGLYANDTGYEIEEFEGKYGIGEVRARTIKQSLKRMQEQFLFDNLI